MEVAHENDEASCYRHFGYDSPEWYRVRATAANMLPPGRVYVFHSSPGSGCPGVDWHVMVQPNDVLAGVVAWNDMQSLARVNGSLNRGTGAFEMTAQEIGGQGRAAKVSGTVDPGTGWLTADVEGPNVSCRSIKVPWFSPPRGG